MISLSFFIVALIILTFWSAFFSGSEIALFSLPSTKIKAYQHSPDPKKQIIANLVLKPRDLFVTVFMVNTLVNLLLQNVASSMFGTASGWALRVGVPLFITLILGEIIPKYIALQENARISALVVPLIYRITNATGPLREWTIRITEPISRSLFFFLKKEKMISRQELQHALEQSKEVGILNQEEAEFIKGYIDLQEAQVKELMRPREDVIFFDIHSPLNRLKHLFVDQELTRIPVCDGELDQVIGIIDSRTFFLYQEQVTSIEALKEKLASPFFVPETVPAKKLLHRFHEQGTEIALAIDEYGTISGLITREDIVEEVIGEVVDRRDLTPLYTKSGKNALIASGKLELSEFEELFNITLNSKYNAVSLGGWLIEQMGDIPRTGAQWETKDFTFQILEAAPHRIKRIYVVYKKKGGT